MSTTLSKKLAFISVAADNPDTVRNFYEKFFGIDFAQALTDQQVTFTAPIDEDGIDVAIGPKHNAQDSVVAYYAVDDIKAAMSEATAAGGKVIWGPQALPIPPAYQNQYKAHVQNFRPDDAKSASDWDTVGQGALVADPAGNPVGLVQLAQHVTGHFNAGPYKRPLPDLRVAAHQEAIQLGQKRAAKK
jgi:predicted enzyme related to lactoylglutathione lyase